MIYYLKLHVLAHLLSFSVFFQVRVIKIHKDYLFLSSRKFAPVKMEAQLTYKAESLILMGIFKGERKTEQEVFYS